MATVDQAATSIDGDAMPPHDLEDAMEKGYDLEMNGDEEENELQLDDPGIIPGENGATAEPIAGHTRYKLNYDGDVLLRPSGEAQAASILDAVGQQVRAFNLAWGRMHLFWLCCKLLAIVSAWLFGNFLVLPLLMVFLEKWVSSEDVFGSRLLFSAYYVVEACVFSVPSWFVVEWIESRFGTKLFVDLRENVVRESLNKRLVLRFAKDTSHKHKAVYMAYAVYHRLWPRLPCGASHRYDLHVLPWEINEKTTFTVQCSICNKEEMVKASLTHFRCMQCLACLSLSLPALTENEYRARPATSAVEGGVVGGSSDTARTLRN